MFKSASRSSSTHQSLESINNLPENEELDTININMKDLNTIDNEEFFEEYNSVNLNPLVLISSSIDTRKGANTDISSINVGGRDHFAINNLYCFCTSASERFSNARGSAYIASKLVISLRSISELHIFATY